MVFEDEGAEERVVDESLKEDEVISELNLRPAVLNEFVGQSLIKENIQIGLEAAKMREAPLDHVMLYGPPGLGKTTLAHILAKEMDVDIKITSGPAIERAGDMAAMLTGLQNGDILFIDEIHRLNKVVEEVLYSAMEDFFLSWVVGKGLAARNINLRINPFCLIGATTRFSMVSGPLRDRFGSVYRLNYYDLDEMEQVLGRSSQILDCNTDSGGIKQIARRSRGTPRIGNRLLRRARDYALVRADGDITEKVAQEALDMLQVDDRGLDQSDKALLETLVEKFSGGPVGLDTLATSLSEESDTVMDVLEPYLMQLGFIERTPRGRVATRAAYQYLGKDFPIGGDNQGRFDGL